jgi:lipopolysaccharide transport system ATP-binding protein
VNAVLSIRRLGKAYRRYPHRRDRVLEKLLPWSGLRHEQIWVLRDVDLEIAAGECVGIIGQNGAGKSTLLKLVTGTTKPTEGGVALGGRVAAILELGMGFHAEFTGRQNVLIAGQLLGLQTHEVASAMAEIERFAEIGDYFDQPVRVYSTGMLVRLAFSIATAVRPDVLIVDEALSVGDAYFQHRSFSRIKAFRDEGTTLLFVSHDPGAVKTLCDRAILLDRGRVARDGSPDQVLDYYNAIIAKREVDYQIREVERTSGRMRETRSGDRTATIEGVDLLDAGGKSVRAVLSNSMVVLRVRFAVRMPLRGVTVGFLIRDRLGNDVFGTNTHYLETLLPPLAVGEHFECRFEVERLALGSGHYSVTIALHEGSSHLAGNYDWWDQALVFQVLPANEPLRIGICNLPIAGSSVQRVEA